MMKCCWAQSQAIFNEAEILALNSRDASEDTKNPLSGSRKHLQPARHKAVKSVSISSFSHFAFNWIFNNYYAVGGTEPPTH